MGPPPSAAAPCGVNKTKIYGRGVGMSLFDLGGQNIPILPLHLGEWGPLATMLVWFGFWAPDPNPMPSARFWRARCLWNDFQNLWSHATPTQTHPPKATIRQTRTPQPRTLQAKRRNGDCLHNSARRSRKPCVVGAFLFFACATAQASSALALTPLVKRFIRHESCNQHTYAQPATRNIQHASWLLQRSTFGGLK